MRVIKLSILCILGVATGCMHAEKALLDRHDYLMAGRTELKHYHVTQIYSRLCIPAPDHVTTALISNVPNLSDMGALDSIVARTPRSQLLDAEEPSLYSTARDITAEYPYETTRWLICNDPIVVGIGGESARTVLVDGADFVNDWVSLGYGQHLITPDDLGQTVVELRMSDRMYFAPRDESMRRSPSAIVRFPEAVTVGQVLRDRSWEKRRSGKPINHR